MKNVSEFGYDTYKTEKEAAEAIIVVVYSSLEEEEIRKWFLLITGTVAEVGKTIEGERSVSKIYPTSKLGTAFHYRLTYRDWKKEFRQKDSVTGNYKNTRFGIYNQTTSKIRIYNKVYEITQSLAHKDCYQFINDEGTLDHAMKECFDLCNEIGDKVVAFKNRDGSVTINVVDGHGKFEDKCDLLPLNVSLHYLTNSKMWTPIYQEKEKKMQIGSKKRDVKIGIEKIEFDACGIWVPLTIQEIRRFRNAMVQEVFLKSWMAKTAIIEFDTGERVSVDEIDTLIKTYEKINQP